MAFILFETSASQTYVTRTPKIKLLSESIYKPGAMSLVYKRRYEEKLAKLKVMVGDNGFEPLTPSV